jgi:hypothetical protein
LSTSGKSPTPTHHNTDSLPPKSSGFHAWFDKYHQFKDIRRRLGIDRYFKDWDAVQFLFRKGTYAPESIKSEGRYPLNLLSIVLNSPNLRLTDAVLSTLAVPDLVWFNHRTVFNRYDHMTFREWADSKVRVWLPHRTPVFFNNSKLIVESISMYATVPERVILPPFIGTPPPFLLWLTQMVAKRFYDIIMAPSLSVTVNERETLSAAEMLTYQHFCFLSHPRADRREVGRWVVVGVCCVGGHAHAHLSSLRALFAWPPKPGCL